MPPTARGPRNKTHPHPPAITMQLNPPVDLPTAKTGFTGKCSKALKPYEHWTLKELIDQGFEEIIWDGK